MYPDAVGPSIFLSGGTVSPGSRFSTKLHSEGSFDVSNSGSFEMSKSLM